MTGAASGPVASMSIFRMEDGNFVQIKKLALVKYESFELNRPGVDVDTGLCK